MKKASGVSPLERGGLDIVARERIVRASQG